MIRHSRLKFAALAGLGLATSQTFAGTWINPNGGIWSDPANWSGGVPVAPAVAQFEGNAQFQVGITAPTTTGDLNFAAGTVSFSLLSQNNASLQVANFNMTGGDLLLNKLVAGAPTVTEVGYSGAFNFTGGTLEITNYWRPAQTAGSFETGDGTMNQGTAIAFLSGTAGSASVPTLVLSGGGQVDFANNPQGMIVGASGGQAVIKVTGANSALALPSTAGTLYLGAGMTRVNGVLTPAVGTINLSDQATLSAAVINVGISGGTGSIVVDNSTCNATSVLSIGISNRQDATQSPSHGTVIVRNGGSISTTALQVGVSGGDGTLDVGTGGTVDASSITAIADNLSADDSTLNAGMMTIHDGGQVHASALIIGAAKNSQATVLVDGAASRLTATNINIQAPASLLSVTNGASVSLTGSSDRELIIAGLGAAAHVVVDGVGSDISIPHGGIALGGGLGEATSGQVDLTNGATLEATQIAIGGSGGTGILNVGKPDGSDTANVVVSTPKSASGSISVMTGALNVYPRGIISMPSGGLSAGDLSSIATPVASPLVHLLGGSLDFKTVFLAPNSFDWQSGTLTVGMQLVQPGGFTVPKDGTLIASGLFQNSVQNYGTTHVKGEVLVHGDFVSSGTVEFDIASATNFSYLDLDGSAAFGPPTDASFFFYHGVLKLDLVDGYVPPLGTVFDLVDWSSEFFDLGYTLDVSDADLHGLTWDTSRFDLDGTISVVPEPAMLGLIALGGLMLGRRRLLA